MGVKHRTKSYDSPLGQYLRDRRIAAGLTQVTVAARIGVSQNSIQRYESGELEPRLHRLRQIGAVLGFDPVDALTACQE